MSKIIKWLATLLCITALLCLLVACGGDKNEGETPSASKGFKYTVNEDGKTCTITNIGECQDADIVIDQIDGMPVTAIDIYAFSSRNNLKSVTIGDSVTSINNYAFYNCPSLTSVTIGNGVTSIGNSAFRDCTALTSVTIGNSVTSIGERTFQNCFSLPNITFPNSITSIGEQAFEDCSSLTSVIVPNSVTSIGLSAFKGCSSLTSITLPFVGATKDGTSNTLLGYIFGASFFTHNGESVPASLKTVVITDSTSIGDDAFRYCSSLTSITIPNSVTSIGNQAFRDCSGLTNITIPNSIKSIGNYAFNACSSLTDIYFTGSEEEWNALKNNNRNAGISLNTTIHFGYTPN